MQLFLFECNLHNFLKETIFLYVQFKFLRNAYSEFMSSDQNKTEI